MKSSHPGRTSSYEFSDAGFGLGKIYKDEVTRIAVISNSNISVGFRQNVFLLVYIKLFTFSDKNEIMSSWANFEL